MNFAMVLAILAVLLLSTTATAAEVTAPENDDEIAASDEAPDVAEDAKVQVTEEGATASAIAFGGPTMTATVDEALPDAGAPAMNALTSSPATVQRDDHDGATSTDALQPDAVPQGEEPAGAAEAHEEANRNDAGGVHLADAHNMPYLDGEHAVRGSPTEGMPHSADGQHHQHAASETQPDDWVAAAPGQILWTASHSAIPPAATAAPVNTSNEQVDTSGGEPIAGWTMAAPAAGEDVGAAGEIANDAPDG